MNMMDSSSTPWRVVYVDRSGGRKALASRHFATKEAGVAFCRKLPKDDVLTWPCRTTIND